MLRYSLKWGGIIAALGFIWLLIEYFFGYQSDKIGQHSSMTNLVLLPNMLIIHLALTEFKRMTGPKSAFKHLMIGAFCFTGIAVVLVPFLQWIFFSFINPGYFEFFSRFKVEHELMTTLEAQEFYTLSNFLTTGVVATALTQLTLSAIVSYLLLKKEVQPNS